MGHYKNPLTVRTVRETLHSNGMFLVPQRTGYKVIQTNNQPVFVTNLAEALQVASPNAKGKTNAVSQS